MKQYSDYEIVDFLTDDSFVEWATSKSLQKASFWSDWPQQYPLKAEVYSQAMEIVQSLKILPSDELSNAEIDQLVREVSLRTIPAQEHEPQILQPNKWYQSSWLKIAAALILVSLFGLTVVIQNRKEKEVSAIAPAAQVQTRPGVIRLPDNSIVILKPGSKLSYQSDFNSEKRIVKLEGEAFFEVTANPDKPFIVRTDDLITKVLGTSFTIKAYRAEKSTKVTVNTGKVSVLKRPMATAEDLISNDFMKDAEVVLLSPNQEATFYKKEIKIVKNTLSEPTPLSDEATQIRFKFIETPFSEVVAELSSAYGIKIVYNEQDMANCPLTAHLSRQHLYERLDLICQAVEAKYEIVNGIVVIRGKGCN